ncbi:DNA alkylation repair protein [Pedobacter gandavensis]|uniref:DNA alkylation repair protein n=1 Tax=Pedobacter gandavensis TaxID=2679963 RepID=A0ABR6F0Y7_9SPHI|nr:DNA alkylation repair protein [Pedobacter gandavensis]MBB2151205.1 DNA alkylation repair protein [Pedobacter gandavensis]
MSSLLKNIYSPVFYQGLSEVLIQTLPSFDHKKFMMEIFDEDFENKELKARMRHTAKVLHQFLPADYGERVDLLVEVVQALRVARQGEDSLAYMFLPDYIETYGIDDFENSMRAIVYLTQFVSCEFAVRPFMLKYGERMLSQMTAWSLHENHKVRRLATEGTRPRLPWAMALPELKRDPRPVLPLLENLKNDPSEWVRRSVANHLNDIAKDHPALVIEIAKQWKGKHKETDAIIKHGCRTLLKQGHVEILKHYGLDSEHVHVGNFQISTPVTQIGGDLHFSFDLFNALQETQTIRLEYGLYYKRQNGSWSKKVFKISEKSYAAKEEVKVSRKQSFKLITTRKFYPGIQQLSIIVNGVEKVLKEFELLY